MKSLGISLAFAAILGFVGCNKPSEPAATTATKAADDQRHDHGAGSHDHGTEGHGHGVGPHEGTVADWGGGKYHVEFTVDHDKQQATVFVFGSDEKTPAPIDAATIELSALKASPQESDPAGKASRFVGTHEKLGVVQEYAGTLTGVIDGTPYSGDFKEEAHVGHDHK
jgi:hypothetical protein